MALTGNAKDREHFRAELEAMFEADQRGRQEAHRAMIEHGHASPEVRAVWEKQSAVDQAHCARLVDIIDAIGWPMSSEFGHKAAQGAFFILQHGDHHLQMRFLPMVRVAAEAGDVEWQHLALLEDRIRIRSGQKQLYGSQLSFDADSKTLVPLPIEDEEQVDARRETMGLGTLAAYVKESTARMSQMSR